MDILTTHKRPKLELVIDEFIDLIQALLKKAIDKDALFEELKNAVKSKDIHSLISKLLGLSSLFTEKIRKTILEFETYFHKANLSDEEKGLIHSKGSTKIINTPDFLLTDPRQNGPELRATPTLP